MGCFPLGDELAVKLARALQIHKDLGVCSELAVGGCEGEHLKEATIWCSLRPRRSAGLGRDLRGMEKQQLFPARAGKDRGSIGTGT